MSAELSKDDVAKVARLSMLNVTDEDLDAFTPQLAAILAHAHDMDALDVDGVPPTAHPYPLVNVFRADVAESFDDIRDEVLDAAPEAEAGRFRVPPALGEEP